MNNIRKDLEGLVKSTTGIDVTKVGEALDAISEIIRSLPEKVPETTITYRYINNLLQLLEGFPSRTPSVVDVETKLVILGSKIHLVGVMQKIIQNPERRKVAPKNKIWKNVQVCFPRFMDFNLDVYRCGVRYINQNAYSFCIKFERVKSKAGGGDSNRVSNQDLTTALKAFISHLESFVELEVEKYKVEENYRIWSIERDSIIYCEFMWRSSEEQSDMTN